MGKYLAAYSTVQGFPQWLSHKESACGAGDAGSSLGWEDPLEEGMATHSSTLAWRIPWTEERGGLQSIGSQRVGHDEVTEHTRIFINEPSGHRCLLVKQQ